MTIHEIEQVITAYANAFKELRKDELAQPISDLPCPPGRIRYALFAYAEHLIANGVTDKDSLENLKMKYALLSARFHEDADRINSAWRSYERSQKARDFILSKGGPAAFLPSIEDTVEFHNFLADCMGNYDVGA